MTRKTLRKGTVVSIAAVLCSLALVGCTGEEKIALKPTAALPKAEGTVTAWKDNLDDIVVDIEAKHLVPPIEMMDHIHYTAWAKDGNTVSRLGTLKLEGGSVGRLVAKTQMKHFKVSVTIDDGPSPDKPKPFPILKSVAPIRAGQLS